MPVKFRGIARIFFYAAAALYPALIFYFLVIHKAPVRIFSLFIMAFALFVFVTGTSKKKAIKNPAPRFGLLSFFSA